MALFFFFSAKLPLREPFSRKDFAEARGSGGGRGCRVCHKAAALHSLMSATATRRRPPAIPAAENFSLAVFLLETHQQR